MAAMDPGLVGALPTPAVDPRVAILAKLFAGAGGNPGAPVPTGIPPTAAAAPAGMTKPQGPTAGGPPMPTGAKAPQSAESTSDTPPGVTPPLSEQEYAAKNPGTPTAPYIEPSLKQRMLMGIFAAMMNQGQRGSGTQMENEYLNRIYQGEQQNKTQPAQDAAAAHQRYMSYMEGQKAPLDIKAEQGEIAERAAQTDADKALANQRESGPAKALTPEEQSFNSLLGAVNPATKKPYTPFEAYQELKQASEKPATDAGITPGKIVEDQVGSAPDPKNYPQGAQDPKYIAARQAYGKAAERVSNEMAGSQGQARGQAYGEWRPVQTIDPQTGNIVWTFAKSAVAEGAAPAAQGAAAERRQALVNDISQSLDRVKSSLKVFDSPVLQKMNLAAALADPNSTAAQFLQQAPRGELNEDQQNAVADLFNLREQAMAMRSVLGAGGGAEDVRRAILSALPGVGTPSSKFGERQISDLQTSIKKLGEGIPGIKGGPAKEEQETKTKGKYATGFTPD